MEYTAEQYAAIYTHNRNVIVIAGAGSGKTRVLVDRFVALLEANPGWPLPSLVAITFTEKAAREMRDRVRQAIEQRIGASDGDALTFWRVHQAALDSARIGTIHGLCTTLLRANAADLGIDPGFEVLDEADSALLCDEAIEAALTALIDTPAARLFTYYETKSIRDVLWPSLDRDLSPFLPLPIGTDSKPSRQTDSPSPSTERGAGGEVNLLYAEYAADHLNHLRADPAFIAALSWQPEVMPDESDKRFLVWQSALEAAERIFSDDLNTAFSALHDCAACITLRGGKALAWGGQEHFDRAKEVLSLIKGKAQDAIDLIGDPPGEADALAAELRPLWVAAIGLAQTHYRWLKDRDRTLDYNDLETLARDLLRREHVQARYRGAEFNHVLVDEFQDTNAAQRDIIYALAGLDRPGSLFVAGDPKQSIYAFRGADVSVFEQVRREIVGAGGVEIPLTTSFRAHQALVDGLNAVFSQLLVKGDGAGRDHAIAYGPPMIGFRASKEHHAPAFDVILLEKKHAHDGEGAAEPMRRWEAHALAERIGAMVAEGWPVWDKQNGGYRPVGYGDFAVLFQSSASMPLVEDAFKNAAIPYVTVAGKGFYDRPEVWDLLNLLKTLYNPADDLALASVLRSPLYNVGDDGLYALQLTSPPAPLSVDGEGESSSQRVSLWAALMSDSVEGLPEGEALAFARESLGRLRAVAGRITITELLTRALEETALVATLTGLLDGARRVENVQKLLDVARRSGRVTAGDFILHLQNLSEQVTREGEAPIETEGAVQLMTVHASKGLEFPVVALFDATWEGRNYDPLLMFDPHIGAVFKVPDEDGKPSVKPCAYRLAGGYAEERRAAERLRLFYVGATRAQDRLIVTGHSTGKRDNWLIRLKEVLDLPESLDGEDESQTSEYEWGAVKYSVPRTPPDPERAPRRPTQSGWDRLK